MLWQAMVGISRLKFLTFTLVTLLLSFSWLYWQQLPLPGFKVLLVSLLALCAHIAVNAWNEYLDFRSGLDLTTSRTPFSGGSGTLPQHPQFVWLAKTIAVTSTLLVALGGLWLCIDSGWALAWFGLPGLALIVLYTGPINRSPWLCLVAPGVGFGVVIAAGSIMALQGHVPSSAWWLAAMVMLMANNLLLLNQLPDIEADRAVGRRHLAIVYGKATALWIFRSQWLAVYLAICVAVSCQQLPLTSVLVVLTLPLAWRLEQNLRISMQSSIQSSLPHTLPTALGLNVALVHAVPLLLSLGLWMSAFL